MAVARINFPRILPLVSMRSIVILSLLLVSLLTSGCTPEQDLHTRIDSIVKPHLFSIASWEISTLRQGIQHWLSDNEADISDDVQVVTSYFQAIERDGSLTSLVEQIINSQIRDVLAEQGIFNPITEHEFSFPPLNFRLEKLPHLLVISPRDRINSMQEIVLEQGLSLDKKEDIETRVDDLGVSSLVVELGGIATYPALINSQASLRHTIDTITEEWLHQYLAFKPLGFLYVLDLTGLVRNYEIATINESLVGIVSKEIGDLVYQKHYPLYEDKAVQVSESEFDFNDEMREIRITVGAYLARGEIQQAEEFMEYKRQYLISMGFYIRKLNQAYFAFHGTYAHSPGFISPIGLELKELRNRSISLTAFLRTVAAMTSRQDLSNSVN
ncbi:hypothetical protein ACFLUJ_04535 [Chloroflexota bacterium]